MGGASCPTHARCNFRLSDPQKCDTDDPQGTCWAIPKECPPVVFGVSSRACGSLTCNDECTLIEQMTPWYPYNLCPQ
jgi:hypothetical protein